MTTLTAKHQRLAALRPLSPESVASLAAAWDVRMVYESNNIGATASRCAKPNWCCPKASRFPASRSRITSQPWKRQKTEDRFAPRQKKSCPPDPTDLPPLTPDY